MNQVEFHNLVPAFATVQPAKHFMPNPLKKGTDTQVEIKSGVVVREVLHNNIEVPISLILTTCGE